MKDLSAQVTWDNFVVSNTIIDGPVTSVGARSTKWVSNSITFNGDDVYN